MSVRTVVVISSIVILVAVAIVVARIPNVAEMTENFRQQMRSDTICITVCSHECFIGIQEDGVTDFKEKEDGCLSDCTDRLCPASD